MAKNHGQEQPKVLTSDEMNYLIYRYLQECGFHHSAFTFAHESHMASVQINPNLVPPAALVTFVQKGLQYMEAEANIDPDTQEIAKEFSTLQTADLLTKDIDELRRLALEQQEQQQAQIQEAMTQQQPPQQQAKAKRAGAKRERAPAQQQRAAAAEEEPQQQQQPARQQRQQQRLQQQRQQQPAQHPKQEHPQQEADQQQQQPQRQQQQQAPQPPPPQGQQQQQQQGGAAAEAAAAAAAEGPVPMEEDNAAASDSSSLEILQTEEHEGLSAEAFICSWSPLEPLVLTGSSGDPCARIWDFGPAADHSKPRILAPPANEPAGTKEPGKEQTKDVTAAEWHPSGNLIACGSFNGAIRIWRKDGTLEKMLDIYEGPVFALKWHKGGDMLLTGSADLETHLVDARTWRIKQSWSFHKGATLDADWRDDTTFATCSNDGTIAVCKLGSDKPLKVFGGQTSEVNMVRWDPTKELLAASSDDSMVRIWRLSQDTPIAVYKHGQDIYSMKWSPGIAAEGAGQLLATASLDKTVRLWDVSSGREVQRLELPDSSYCMCFSPDGKYVAGGCMDGVLRFYHAADGRECASYATAGNILDVTWYRTADKIACTTGAKKVVLLELKRG